MTKHFTIGMAGHIDHGKTTLTKALTGVETDRLKEEKERQISIELGYAPLRMEDGSVISIIDVPGHERFIRQMIAGVSGIDLVILVVAADEGIMPQTKEHLEILKFLQVPKGIVAITKKDKVDPDFLQLVKEEIVDELQGTIFHDASVVFVDSIKKEGKEEVINTIKTELETVQEKQLAGKFRLPIDQVFTIKGQGTIVRGTILEGAVRIGESLEILPKRHEVKVRQLQVHNEFVDIAYAGQRVAVNIPNIGKQELKRGEVLAQPNTYETSDTIDVALQFIDKLQHPIKQRSLIKLHIGTSEILGKIVFFDRNEYTGGQDEEVLCQIRLDEPITAKRGDKLIIRRPSPVETMGGGWIIHPIGQRYKFGMDTIMKLDKMKQGTLEDRLKVIFQRKVLLTKEEIFTELGLEKTDLEHLEEKGVLIRILHNLYAFYSDISDLETDIMNFVQNYHIEHPLKAGVQKAELLSRVGKSKPKEVIEFTLGKLIQCDLINKQENIIFSSGFQPAFPKQWQKRMEQVVRSLSRDKLTPEPFQKYSKEAGLPEKEAMDLLYFLVSQSKAYELGDKHIICAEAFHAAVRHLKDGSAEEIELSAIKDKLGFSRKYLIPFVELMDDLKITERLGTIRKWK